MRSIYGQANRPGCCSTQRNNGEAAAHMLFLFPYAVVNFGIPNNCFNNSLMTSDPKQWSSLVLIINFLHTKKNKTEKK